MLKWPRILLVIFWFSHQRRNNKIFDSNLLVASGIVLSGNNYVKIDKLFDFVRVAFIFKLSFYDYQQSISGKILCSRTGKFNG